MRRRLGAVARLLAVAFCASFLCYITARLFLAYQIRRSSQMLEEVQKVKVGDSEDSIGTLLKRFGSYHWDVQLGSHEDYNYVLEINPWRFPTHPDGKSGGREHAIGRAWNSRFRRAIGLRQWLVTSEIAIKDQRVIAVQTETLVEGRSMWLGILSRLAEKSRDFERGATSFDFSVEESNDLVTPAILEMDSGGGTSWEFRTNPTSPIIQREMANRLNFGCLDSLAGCDNVCELIPEAARFFSEHNELAPKGGGWDEDSQGCLKHNPRQNQYR